MRGRKNKGTTISKRESFGTTKEKTAPRRSGITINVPGLVERFWRQGLGGGAGRMDAKKREGLEVSVRNSLSV